MSTPTPTTGDGPSGTASNIPTCTTAVPGKYGEVPPDACNAKWAFHPNFAANIAWAVLMGATTCVHLIQAIYYKKKFCWVVIMGGVWEAASFALRAAGSRDQQQVAYQTVSQILILLAPLWLNAFVYMTVSRLIYYVHVDQRVMRVRAIVLTRIFVWLDITCFLIQAVGGIMLSGDDDKIMDIGMNIYVAGIAVQQAVIVVFSILTVQFFRELAEKGRLDRPVRLTKWLLIVLFANFVLITIRIIFRLVEFIPGANWDNPILTNEAYGWFLDALPVFLGLVLLNIIHPGLILRGPASEFPKMSRAEKKEIKKQKKEAKRQEKEAKREARIQRRMEKEAKREARIQRRMEKKVGRNVWVEIDTEETSLDNSRLGRYDDQGVELSSPEDSRYDRSEDPSAQRYGSSRI